MNLPSIQFAGDYRFVQTNPKMQRFQTTLTLSHFNNLIKTKLTTIPEPKKRVNTGLLGRRDFTYEVKQNGDMWVHINPLRGIIENSREEARMAAPLLEFLAKKLNHKALKSVQECGFDHARQHHLPADEVLDEHQRTFYYDVNYKDVSVKELRY